MVYHPFGQPEMLGVDATITQDPSTLKWVVEFDVRVNLVGDLHRFVDDQNHFSHVATPMDDQVTPILPARSEEGWGRLSNIRLQLPNQSQADEAYHGILRSLDEYVSSKVALDDPNMVPAETYEFR